MNATTFNAETSRRSGSTFHLRPEIRRAAVNAAGPKGVAVVNIIAEDARKTGISTATNAEIGAALGLSGKSASRLMTQLARGGVLTVREMRGAGPGRRRFVAVADVAEDGRRILPAAIFDDASVTVEVFGFNGARWLVPVTKLRRRDDLPDVETIAESRPKPSAVRPRIGDKRDPYSAGIGDKIGVSSRARVRLPEDSEKRATRPADAGSPATATLRPPRTPEAGSRNPVNFAQGSRRSADKVPPIRTSGGPSIASGAQTSRDSSATRAEKAPAGTAETVSATSKTSESAADSRTAKAVRLVVEAHAAEYSRTFKHRRTPKGSDRGHAKTLLGAIVEAVPGVSIDRAVEIAAETFRRCFAVRRTRERIAAGIVDPFAAVAHARSAFVPEALSVLAERARDERVKAETAERRERELEERRARMNPAAGTIDFSKTLEEMRRTRAEQESERLKREAEAEAEKAKQLEERKAALRRQLAGVAS